MIYPNLHARLVSHVNVHPATGCWLWNCRAHGRGPFKYGRLNIRVQGTHRMVAAHRAMLVLQECGADVAIPLFWRVYEAYSVAGFEADHHESCTSCLCINAQHLQWLPRAEHLAITRARGQGIYLRNGLHQRLAA